MAFEIKQNDTRPRFVAVLKDEFGEPGEAAIDLTTATGVRFLMRVVPPDPESPPAAVVDEPAAITDAVNGEVEYEWVAADTDTVGEYQVEFEITWSDGGIETVPNDGYLDVSVVDDIG